MCPRGRALTGLLAAALAGLLWSCGDATADPEEAETGLTMLDVMIQIDQAYQTVVPNFRNSEAFGRTGLAAQQILTWTEDPLFEEFTKSDRFIGGDTDRYFRLREQLKGGAQMILDGTRSADLDAMRDGFIAMKTSCIACHKRFSPSY